MEPLSLRGRLQEQVRPATTTAVALVIWTFLLPRVKGLDAPWNIIWGLVELTLTVLVTHFISAALRPWPQFDVVLHKLHDGVEKRGDELNGDNVRLTPNAQGSVWLLGRVWYRQHGWLASKVAKRLWAHELRIVLRFAPANRNLLVFETATGFQWDVAGSATEMALRSHPLPKATATCELGTFRCELKVETPHGPVALQCETVMEGLAGTRIRFVTRARCGLHSIIVED